MLVRRRLRLLAGLHATLLAAGLLAAGGLQPAPPAEPSAQGPQPAAAAPAPAPDAPPLLLERAVAAPVPAAAVRVEPVRAGSRSAPAPAPPRAGRTAAAVERAPSSPQARGEAALAALHYDWRRLGYSIRFVPYAGGQLGKANSRRREITIYVKPGQSELSLRTTIAHELGHALDFGFGTAERRDTYRRIRGLPRTSAWFPCSGCEDFASPAGDFAESFAVWLVGPGDFRGRLRPAPGPQQLRELSALFRVPVRPTAHPAAAPQPAPSDPPQEEKPGPLPPLLEDPPGGV